MTEPGLAAIEDLGHYVARCTSMYRKGDEVEIRGDVTHIYAMPPVPGRGLLIDVHFVKVGFTEATDPDPGEFVRLVKAACAAPGFYATINLDELRGGPSYITLGAWLGSQDLALRFLALGELLGQWEVVTPARMHVTGDLAEEMAERGFVMLAFKADNLLA